MTRGALETPPRPGTAGADRTTTPADRAVHPAARPVAALALIAALLLSPGRLAAAVDPVGPITEVQLRGNSASTEGEIRGKLQSRVGRPLDKKLIEEDRKRLLKLGWFSDVRTFYTDDPKGQGFILIFEVDEMPVLRQVEFRGRKHVRIKDLEQNTGLKVGERADHLKAQMEVNHIRRIYQDKGFEFAQVRLLEGGKPGDTKVVYEIFEGPKCRLNSISFVGNTYSSDGILRTKISSKPALIGSLGGRYHADEVEEDARKLREYYQGQGYFEVEVRPVKRQGAQLGDLDLTFVISEGIQYKVRKIEFEGNEKVSTDKLREGLVLHSGMPYSDAIRDADRKNLELKYGSIGCIEAEIAPEWKVTDQRGVVDIIYQIREGEPYLLGHIYIKGNSRTQSRVLLREATQAGLVPGEPLDVTRIENYKKRLNNLRYFQTDPQMGKPLEVKITNHRAPDKPYLDPGNGPGALPDIEEIIRTRMQGPDDAPVRATASATPPARAVRPTQAIRTRMQGPAPLDDIPIVEAPPPAGDGEGPAVIPFGGGGFDRPGSIPPAPELPPIAVPAPGPNVAAPGQPGLPPALAPEMPAQPGTRTPPAGAGEPPGTFPSLPGGNMTDVGPDRQEPFPNRSYADIVTQVDEGPTGRLMLGFGANSYGGLSGNFILHESNFNIFNIPRNFSELTNGQAFRGAGQDFRVELSPGTLINRAVVSFRDPYVFDLPIGFGAQGYVFQRVYSDFTEGRGGGRFSLGRQFGTQTYADVALRVEDVNFHGFRVPAPADYLAASGHTFLASIRPSLRFDNRNDPFAPNKGQYLELAFEQGWGTFSFPKFTVEGRQYFKMGSRPDGSGVRFITMRGFYGVSGRDTPVYERFYAGDFRSMRGFAYRGVGPRVLGVNVGGLQEAIGSVEYQFPWTANDKLQQVVFCDFGTVENSYDFNNFRAAVGTGLRIYLPQQMFGPLPLAFDFAYPVAKTQDDHTRVFTFFIGAFW